MLTPKGVNNTIKYGSGTVLESPTNPRPGRPPRPCPRSEQDHDQPIVHRQAAQRPHGPTSLPGPLSSSGSGLETEHSHLILCTTYHYYNFILKYYLWPFLIISQLVLIFLHIMTITSLWEVGHRPVPHRAGGSGTRGFGWPRRSGSGCA